MQTLNDLKAMLPANKRHLLDQAHAIGLNELDAKLANKPRPAGTSPGALPPLSKSLLYHALLLKAQSFQIPVHRFDLVRDEKHRMGLIQTQTDANMGYMVTLLNKHLKIGHPDPSVSNQQAVAEYFDNFATILWEALDAVLSCDDPVKAVALLRLMQEDGFDAVQLAADPEPDTHLKVA
jgi:hypothetical protein